MVSAHPAWFIISGAFFAASVLLNLVLIAVALRIGKRLDAVLDDAKRVTERVGDKAASVAASAENIALTAQRTVDDVRARTLDLLGRAEEESGHVAVRLTTAGAALTTVLLAVRIAGAVRGMFGLTGRSRLSPAGTRPAR